MLIELIKSGDTDGARNALHNDPQLALQKDENGLSAIMWAAYYKNAELIETIKGLNIDGVSIFEACALDDTQKISQLAENDPGIVNRYAPDGFQPIGLACYFDNLNAVEVLISLGSDVNSPSQNAFMVCPLHSSVSAGSFPITKILLENGADPNKPQQNGILPVHSAAHTGNVDILNLLIEFGADIKATSEDGKNARDYAQDAENSGEILAILDS